MYKINNWRCYTFYPKSLPSLERHPLNKTTAIHMWTLLKLVIRRGVPFPAAHFHRMVLGSSPSPSPSTAPLAGRAAAIIQHLGEVIESLLLRVRERVAEEEVENMLVNDPNFGVLGVSLLAFPRVGVHGPCGLGKQKKRKEKKMIVSRPSQKKQQLTPQQLARIY